MIAVDTPYERSHPVFPTRIVPVLVFALVGNIVLALAAQTLASDWLMNVANVAIPTCLVFATGIAAARVVLDNSLAVWTPLPWFLIACLTYFGIGPLVYWFGDTLTIEYCDGYYEVAALSLLRTNLLNSVAILLIIVGFTMALLVPLPLAKSEAYRFDLKRTKVVLAIFLGIGVTLKYLVVLPYDIAWTPHETDQPLLPGIIERCAVFTYLGLLILVHLAASGHRGFIAWAVLFATLEFAVSILRFSKIDTLLIFFMIVLGIYSVRPRLSILAGGGLISLVIYYLLVPVALAGREMIWNQNDRSLSARLEFIKDYVSGEKKPKETADSDVNVRWARLNYANAQAFAMDAFDAGNPGDSFMNIFYTVIPRFVWPDKPQMVTGIEFNHLVTGQLGTQSSPGIFGEAYWNGGWPFVFLASLYVGALFAGFTKISLHCMVESDFQWLPVVFFGMYSGFRADDWFTVIYIGSIPMLIAFALMLRLGIELSQLPERAHA